MPFATEKHFRLKLQQWQSRVLGALLCTALLLALPLPLHAQEKEAPATFNAGEVFLPVLLNRIPYLLQWQNLQTGYFEQVEHNPADFQSTFNPWKQLSILQLAVAWGYKSDQNPYYHSEEILQRIILCGNALVSHMTDKGEWLHVKPDGSNWGYEDNTFGVQRWIIAMAITWDALPAEVIQSWKKAIITNLNNSLEHRNIKEPYVVTNHFMNKAVSLYYAGKLFDIDAYVQAGVRYIHYVIDQQHKEGYWVEGTGPVMRYGLVYLDCLGIYYALSKDPLAYAALERAARYYWLFTFPNTHLGSVMDGRNNYRRNTGARSVGLAQTPTGRALLQHNFGNVDVVKVMPADTASMHLMYARGNSVEIPEDINKDSFRYLFSDEKVVVHVDQGWRVYLSAHTAKTTNNQWHYDYQNHIEIYKDGVGLILGGGNSKGIPLFSNFVVGDYQRARRPLGGERVDMAQTYPRGIHYITASASIGQSGNQDLLTLNYAGNNSVAYNIEVLSATQLKINYTAKVQETNLPQTVNFTFIPIFGKTLESAAGLSIPLRNANDQTMQVYDKLGGQLRLPEWSVLLPESAELYWPVVPYDQYQKSGLGTVQDARLVVRIPVSTTEPSGSITITVP